MLKIPGGDQIAVADCITGVAPALPGTNSSHLIVLILTLYRVLPIILNEYCREGPVSMVINLVFRLVR